jgi:hypothetical protein
VKLGVFEPWWQLLFLDFIDKWHYLNMVKDYL